MEVYSIIEALRDVVESGVSVPLTGKVMVDKEEVLELISDMVKVFPKGLKEAKRVLDEKEAILFEARKEAEKVFANLNKTVERYIEEHEVIKKANERANEIVANAERYAKEIRTGTKGYAEGILVKVQDILKNTISVIESNCDELRN